MDPVTAFSLVTGLLGALGISGKDLAKVANREKKQPVSIAFENTVTYHAKWFPNIREELSSFLGSEAVKTALAHKVVGESSDWGFLTEAFIGFVDPYLGKDLESRRSVEAILKTFVKEFDEALLQSHMGLLHHDKKEEARFQDLERTIRREIQESHHLTESLISSEFTDLQAKLVSESQTSSAAIHKIDRSSDLIAQFLLASQGLLRWRRTLANGIEIERPEFEAIMNRIHEEPTSTTLVLGPPGSGKSALLAKVGVRLVEQGRAVLAIKADMLGAAIQTLDDLRTWLKLTVDPRDAVIALGKQGPITLLVDQLDAVSEFSDRNSGRLNVLLELIHHLSGIFGVHIVASCRGFEYRHDIRLANIDAIHSELHPPAWESLSPILDAAGHASSKFAPALRELLRVPLHLKLFLDIAKPRMEFESLHSLLAELWKQRVIDAAGPMDRLSLLEEMAGSMSKEEVLWIPDAFADEHPHALQSLLSSEIVVRGEDGQTIGFRHQTYYDYTLARAFAKGAISLADHVLARQDGLFVRPALLSGLQYLRATARSAYHRQLSHLLDARPRPHVLLLILEFLGEQKDPDEIEAAHLLPLLGTGAEGQRILRVVKGSPGWFVRLRLSDALAMWMAMPSEKAVHCAPVLSAAAKFDPENVMCLLEDHWIGNPSYDHLTLSVLSDFESWSEKPVRAIMDLLKRNPSWHLEHVIDKIFETAPQEAARVLRAYLDRRLEGALQEASLLVSPSPPNAGESDDFLYSLRRDPKEPIRHLFENNREFFRIEQWAADEPKALLEGVWPWFVQVSYLLAFDARPHLNRYRQDPLVGRFRGDVPTVPLLKGIVGAVEALAKSDPDAFLEFAGANHDSDLMLAHRVIARGYQHVCSLRISASLGYLLGDPRRLAIGDYHDDHCETRKLIRLLSASLESEDLRMLERAVMEYKMYLSPPKMATARERLAEIRWNRQARLRLLRAFAPGTLSTSGARLREEEERALPGTTDVERMATGGWIGPRIAVEEMEKSSDDDLLHLIQTLPDATQWDNPRGERNLRMGRTGGAIQLSREFRELGKRDPDRVAALLPKLPPNTHGMYAGAGLEGIAEGGHDPEQVFGLVMELQSRGFVSSDFRSGAASAVEKCVTRFRPPREMLSLLLEWLEVEPRPQWPEEDDREEENPAKRTGPIVFGSHQTWFLPPGRGPILRALASSYLNGDHPDLESWRRLIEARLSKERHPSMWVNTLMHMPILYRGDAEEATSLYDGVISTCPLVLRYQFALHSIAYVLRWATPVKVVRQWLERLLEDGSTECLQAYGELLFLYHCIHNDGWSVKHVKRNLSQTAPNDIRRGMAYAASHLWNEVKCRQLASEVLSALALDEDVEVGNAVALVFSLHRHDLSLDQHLRRVITVVLRSPTVLLVAATDLAEVVAPYASYEPEFVSQVIEAILDAGWQEIGDPSRGLALAAETVTNISLTLHRLATHREVGLRIFERLIALNVREAASALDVLDRKPRMGLGFALGGRSRRRHCPHQILPS